MATPPIMPVGFIKERTSDGAVFTLAQPGQPSRLEKGDHVTVWSHRPEKSATARVLGVVTDVRDATGTFTVVKTEMDGPWPADADPLELGNPVYRALEGTYEPDPAS